MPTRILIKLQCWSIGITEWTGGSYRWSADGVGAFRDGGKAEQRVDDGTGEHHRAERQAEWGRRDARRHPKGARASAGDELKTSARPPRGMCRQQFYWWNVSMTVAIAVLESIMTSWVMWVWMCVCNFASVLCVWLCAWDVCSWMCGHVYITNYISIRLFVCAVGGTERRSRSANCNVRKALSNGAAGVDFATRLEWQAWVRPSHQGGPAENGERKHLNGVFAKIFGVGVPYWTFWLWKREATNAGTFNGFLVH